MSENSELKECDLVMKGGITSGIVYPPLVSVLKEKYRFRSIGGTSAGAIAAAATAAAEFGRDTGGFDRLDELRSELAQGDFLFNLFQPSRQTRSLFNSLLYLTQQMKGENALSWKLLVPQLPWLLRKEVPLALLTGAVVGVALAFIFAWLVNGSLQGVGILFALLLAWLGAVAASITQLAFVLFKKVPRNFLGMCTGRKDTMSGKDRPVLTDWLNNQIAVISGLKEKRPLTFSDLKNKPFGDTRDDVALPHQEENITLRMVTSNLSQNQPYILPFRENLFIFNEGEFLQFFPQEVVNYLKAHTSKIGRYHLPANYYFLPEGDDLPIIVATRLSLSFPMLLSAVPLYTIRTEKLLALKPEAAGSASILDEKDLQVNWFSDGGICSNFPIHFFDSWLPTRPTFGVNLTSLPEKGMTTDKSQVRLDTLSPTAETISSPNVDSIYLPKPDECPVTEYISFESASSGDGTQRMPDLLRFLWSIFATAQNYRDNAQSVLPSYRERIVQIRLREDEGGLNLAMPGGTIERVMKKGEEAGQKLATEFTFEWHQWVRFLVLMKQMEASLTEMNKVINNDDIYRKFIKQGQQFNFVGYPYSSDLAWVPDLLQRLQGIGAQLQGWNPSLFATMSDLPLPEPKLRVMPEI